MTTAQQQVLCIRASDLVVRALKLLRLAAYDEVGAVELMEAAVMLESAAAGCRFLSVDLSEQIRVARLSIPQLPALHHPFGPDYVRVRGVDTASLPSFEPAAQLASASSVPVPFAQPGRKADRLKSRRKTGHKPVTRERALQMFAELERQLRLGP
jgi:hypothetical protein